jgi:hypothetical protein
LSEIISRKIIMPVIKLENITWFDAPEHVELPTEALVEISDEEYSSDLVKSTFHKILENYANVQVESFEVKLVMGKGPVLKYRKPRDGELVFSGPLW